MKALSEYYKVPFRDVYCETGGGWLAACIRCAWLTLRYRIGLDQSPSLAPKE